MNNETMYWLINTNNNQIMRDHTGERLVWPASTAQEIIAKMPFYEMEKAAGQ